MFLYHGYDNIRVRRNHCFPLHSLVTYVDGSFKLAKNMYVISRSMVHYSEGFGKSFVDSEPQLPIRLNLCDHSPWRTANSIHLEYEKYVPESLEIIIIISLRILFYHSAHVSSAHSIMEVRARSG